MAKSIAQGAHVFATVRRQLELDDLAAEYGSAIAPVRVDLSDLEFGSIPPVPDSADTTMIRKLASSPADLQCVLGEEIADVPMRRLGQPGEIAYAIIFLASARASFVTGTELLVDGGRAQV